MTQFLKIISRIVMLTAIVCLSACSHTADLPERAQDPEESKLQARFSITVPGNPLSTRATSYLAEGYDPGEGYENYIDIENGDFAFYFFDDHNKFVTKFIVESIIPEEQGDGSKKYYVFGNLDNGLYAKDNPVKVVALANWGKENYPDWTSEDTEEEHTIDDLTNITFDFTAESMNLSRENKIPLYGVTNAKKLDFKTASSDNDYIADIDMIHMLRAFAKVEVVTGSYTLNNNSVRFELESVELTRHNAKGYCAPDRIYQESDYVHGDYDSDYVQNPHVPADVETTDNLQFIDTDGGKRFIAYIPEYKNISRAENEKARMKLMFKDSEDNPFYIDFKDYSSTETAKETSFDILRNNWYKFTVGLRDKNPTVVVEVTPYTSITLEPDFGVNRDEDGNVLDKYGNKISFDGDGNQFFRDKVTNDVILIRDRNAHNIIAKCSSAVDGNINLDGSEIIIDAKGDRVLVRNNEDTNNPKHLKLLVQNSYAMILIKDSYNKFRIKNEGNFAEEASDSIKYTEFLKGQKVDDVLCVVIDSSKKTLLYKVTVESNGNVMTSQ